MIFHHMNPTHIQIQIDRASMRILHFYLAAAFGQCRHLLAEVVAASDLIVVAKAVAVIYSRNSLYFVRHEPQKDENKS